MPRHIQLSLHGRRVGLASDNELIIQGVPRAVTFTPAQDGANVTKITCQVVDSDDRAVAGIFLFDLHLSDAATGLGLTATTASGAVANKAAAGGADYGILTTKKALRVQTDATGKYVLNITDTAKSLFYVAAVLPTPTGQRMSVSPQLTALNYG